MNERRLPSRWKVDTLGVGATDPNPAPAKGNGLYKLEVTVAMCGVLALRVGDGGKTNSVWEGVWSEVMEVCEF